MRQQFQAAAEELGTAFPPDHPAITDHQIRWGRCLLRLGDRDEARQVLESVRGKLESQDGSSDAMERIDELLEQVGRNSA